MRTLAGVGLRFLVFLSIVNVRKLRRQIGSQGQKIEVGRQHFNALHEQEGDQQDGEIGIGEIHDGGMARADGRPTR